jgi:hypothetical protein
MEAQLKGTKTTVSEAIWFRRFIREYWTREGETDSSLL